MKKALALILSAAAVMCLFASCGSTEEETTTAAETSAETTAEETAQPEFPYMNINDEPYTVTAEDGFNDSGVTTLICDTDGTYVFTASDDETTWNIYVLDDKFEDGARYLSQAETPSLSGNGSLEIKNGQYVYIECSCNAFTAESANDAYLEITRGETTEESAQPEFPYMNINDEPYTVTAEDGFDNAGVTTLICDTDGTYVFTASDDETTWNIYVLDEEFEDGARYLSQAQTPSLSGNGSLEIKDGQYVYIECSCNAFTAEAANNASLDITRG